MNDEIQTKCDIIRQINTKKKEHFLKDGFLESMSEMAVEAILDYERSIEEIFINNNKAIENIKQIQKLMENNSIKLKVEGMMDVIGAKRLEDLGIFSSQILRLITESQGE